MSIPKVSVVLTVYNATWCVERAIDSVLSQTIPPDEILVCDDGSSDGTPDYVESLFGSRVQVLRLPHRNASATRGEGLRRARGDWFAFLDADDTWLPRKLETQLDFIREHPEVRHVSSDGIFLSADGILRDSWLSDYFEPVHLLYGDLMPLLIERCFVLMSSVLTERNAYHEVGGLDPGIVYSHDYDLWMRMYARWPAAVLPDRLITYFSSPGALSRRFDARDRDNLELMRRIESGQYRDDPPLQRRAAERAAALEYDLGLTCLRSGRMAEGRERMRRAAARGPLRRRVIATAGSLLPDSAILALRRFEWLKRPMTASRAAVGRIAAPESVRAEEPNDPEARGAA